MITNNQYNALERSVEFFNKKFGDLFNFRTLFFLPFLVISICFYIGNFKVELESRRPAFSKRFMFFADAILFLLTCCWLACIDLGLLFLTLILL